MAERDLTASALAAVQATLVRPVVFFEAEYEGGTLRLHTGVGNISWNGQTWTGAGDMLEITPIRESRAIEAIGFSVRLSGLKQSILATALASMRKNKPGKLWIGFFYPDDALAAEITGAFSSRLWTPFTTPAGYTLNASTAGESAFELRPGPNGRNEVVNVCTNKDDGTEVNGPDGGWNMNTDFSVDENQGYLWAVFAKRLSSGGNFYWGMFSTGGATEAVELASPGPLGGNHGDNNPYWLSATTIACFPNVDTWYLAVGYLHPTAYAGGQSLLSGIWDMSGVKVGSGGDYKFASGTTLARHRCYHYYNADPVDTEAMHLARPIVIPCSVADGPSMIQKIIRMATHDGLIADPYPLRRGRFDTAEIARGTDACVIDLRYEDRLVDLERARERRWTTEDQQLRLAGDKGFNQVAELQDAADAWGESFGPASPLRTGPRGGRSSRS